MVVDKDYRQGLSAEDLVSTLQSLLAAERTVMRLTCRYLADLADTMDTMEDEAGAAGGAGGALLGYADVYHAAERLFGLGVHGTRERIRVGRALRSLPRIEEAIVSGELSYSRAREVTRVATPGDETAWLDLARTLPMRTLERRVVEATGKESPARTEGPAQLRWSTPETVEVTLRLPAEVWALLQRAMEGARRASEASLSEAEALGAVARDALERQNTDADTADPRHTVVLYECQSCARTEVDTGAGPLELGAGAAAALGCGARVRDLRTEGRVVSRGGPLPKAIDRAVRLRDRNMCRVPGCRRRRYVDVHHIAFQSEGGEHSRSNCVCLCTRHHTLLHDGRLRIEGDAEGELVFHDGTGAPLSSPVASHLGTAAVRTAAAPVASHVGTAAVGSAAVGTAAAPVASHLGTAAVGTAAAPVASHLGTAAVGSASVPVGSHVGTGAASAGDEAATLLALMGRRGGWSLDTLVDASGLHVGAVQFGLMSLELDGRVSFDGFGSYAPCTALESRPL
jgi:hypothetical protein